MGRITIFSLQNCPHCIRTKNALTENNIPFTEISLSAHPSKRIDMLSLADRLTVPQVFFNDTHIGGADETIALLSKWVKELESSENNNNKYETLLEKYQKQIESEPDPTDLRLAVPTTPPVDEKPAPPRHEMNTAVKLPDGTSTSVLEVTRKLVGALPSNDLSYYLKLYKNVFTGEEGVNSLMELFGDSIRSREDAVKYGEYLQKKELFDHVCGDHEFQDTNKYFFRLTCHSEPNVLNSFRVWTERVDPESMSLLRRLKLLMGKIESAVTNGSDGVDYVGARENENYPVFEEAVCELQGVVLGTMDEPTRLAFGINLYNLMIQYAFMKVGVPTTSLSRGAFFSGVQFNIGGVLLSFNDLEHGILRANAKAPYSFRKHFDKDDPRIRLALKSADCRIHFALNCGAKSCPPVENFTAEAVQEELRVVAQAFAEQDGNVDVDEANNELRLTMILSWYRSDFAESTSKLPEKVVTFLRGTKKERLQRMIDSGKPISVHFHEYDWGVNACRFDPFEKSTLKATELLDISCTSKKQNRRLSL